MNKNTKTDYSENEVKHLEMIQSVIERMGQNSFRLKEWTITLIAAICAFPASGSSLKFAFVAIISIVIFGFLDTYYLQLERKYRVLYKKALQRNAVLFSLDTSDITNVNTRYWRCFLTKTEGLFYVVCLLAIITVFLWL